MQTLETRLQAVLGTGYRLERELGGGGMSRVFVAEDSVLGRRVVVKVLPPELAAGLNVDRFRREIALAAGLQHPHIVPLHNAGEGDGLFWYTMPLVEGESLRTMLARQGELPIGETVRLLRDVIDALAYAHKQGIVHRDIKPDNVLVTSNHAVVTDFGVAKALSEATGVNTMTSEGMALGTPAYMAPEQAAADPHVDHRADLYAFGAMAYEMLTGRPPFTGNSAQAVLVAHVTTAPAPLTQTRATVPPALEALVLRCLEKKPADRWQSAGEVLSQLEAMATPSGGIAPTRATPAVTPAKPKSKRTWIAAAAAIALVAIAGWAIASRGGSANSGPTRLAVLPIENLGSAEDEDLADGLTEAIAGKLAQVSGLAVVGRTSAMQYKKTTKPVAEIGQELKVSHVLTSTLRREGGGSSRLRIHAELVRTNDGTQVWAESYETEGGGMFSVQADLAERVARALQVTLLAPEREQLAAQPTKNSEAYDAYLRGQALYTRSDDLKEVQAAIALFRQAAHLDPSFAQANAWLSICHALMYWYGYDSGASRLDSASAAVERAAAVAPDLAEVLLARGYLRYWGYLDYDGALTHLNKAVEARPKDPALLAATAYVHRRRGNWDEALRLLEQAIELDPRSRELAYGLGQTYVWLRRFPEAGRYLEQARVITPTDGLTITQLVGLRLAEGGPDAARQVYRTAAEGRDPVDVVRGILVWDPAWLAKYSPEFQAALERLEVGADTALADTYYLLKGVARSARGEPAAARASFDSARVIIERQRAVGMTAEATYHGALARAYAGLGRFGDAVREAEKSVEILPPSRESIGGAGGLGTLAEVYMVAGQKAKAIEVLGRLLAIPSSISVPLLRNDPTWDPLRGEAAFQALVKQ